MEMCSIHAYNLIVRASVGIVDLLYLSVRHFGTRSPAEVLALNSLPETLSVGGSISLNLMELSNLLPNLCNRLSLLDSREGMPNTSNAVTYVSYLWPRMMRAARFCIFSIALVCWSLIDIDIQSSSGCLETDMVSPDLCNSATLLPFLPFLGA